MATKKKTQEKKSEQKLWSLRELINFCKEKGDYPHELIAMFLESYNEQQEVALKHSRLIVNRRDKERYPSHG